MQKDKDSERKRSRLRKECSPQPKSSLFQSFKGYLTNFSYEIKSLSLPFHIHSPAACLSAHGTPFPSFDDCLKHHQSLIWFTYRKNCKINLTIGSDLGWGCMIRAAQMLLAQVFRMFFSQKGRYTDLAYIVSAFLESEARCKYTIDRFVQLARDLYLKEPGDWFSITEVALMLQELHSSAPLKGSQHLKVIVSHQIIDSAQIASFLAFPEAPSPPQTNSYTLFKKKPLLLQPKPALSNSVLLIVTARLGQKGVNESDYAVLLELLKNQHFAGGLGGAPGRARYLTGRNGSKISYLDPHHVQEEIGKMTLEKEMAKFHSRDYWLMGREELDPDVAVCFLFHHHSHLSSFLEAIRGLGELYPSAFFRVRDGGEGREEKVEVGHEAEDEEWSDLGSMESSFIMD